MAYVTTAEELARWEIINGVRQTITAALSCIGVPAVLLSKADSAMQMVSEDTEFLAVTHPRPNRGYVTAEISYSTQQGSPWIVTVKRDTKGEVVNAHTTLDQAVSYMKLALAAEV